MLYFDTSFVTPIVRREATTAKIERFVQQQAVGEVATSQWTRVEFTSLIAREVRMGRLDPDAALDADAEFEAMVADTFVVISPSPQDFVRARQYLQRFETGLRAGDALHLAVAANRGMDAIYSLDKGLLKAGRLLGLPVGTGVRLAGY